MIVIGGEYLGLYHFVKVITSLLILSIGICLAFKSSALSNAIKKSGEVFHNAMRQQNTWPWTMIEAEGSHMPPKISIRITGWIFIIFGILGLLNLIKVGGY